MLAGCSSLRDWPGLMAGLAGLSPTRIVRPLITAYLPARPGLGGISLPRIPSHSGGGSPARASGWPRAWKRKLVSSWQCRRIPAGQGTGDSAFCRTPFWVACHVLGCVWVCVDAGFVRLILVGFCTACGVCGVFCGCLSLINKRVTLRVLDKRPRNQEHKCKTRASPRPLSGRAAFKPGLPLPRACLN